ncbi:MAG: Ppx/GppA family phosphatase [Sphingomonadaceae bacterium]
MIAGAPRARNGQRRSHEAARAVIDIGSNTVRLVIYGGPSRAPTVLWNEKVAARLGRNLAASGTIPDEAMDEALSALARYAVILRDWGITEVEAVATAAPRDADNGAVFLARAASLDLDIRLLSGEEEACASAYGAIGAFPGASGTVIDLGGGSLELVAISEGACRETASLRLGTLRLPTLRAKGNFAKKVRKALGEAGWTHDGPGPFYMVGGTWRALATYAMRANDYPLTDPHGFVLSTGEAERLARKLMRSQPDKLASIRGISTMRAEKLPDAAALLQILLGEIGPDRLIFSSWGLREGLHYQRLEPLEKAKDPLLAGVAAFAGIRGAGVTDAALLAGWSAAAAGRGGAQNERLRLAAAQLALALHFVEPNLRAAHAQEWALDKRWIDCDGRSRAMLAAALLGSLGITAMPERIGLLANEDELREAITWGMAYRLAQRLGATARGALSASELAIKDDRLTLSIAEDHAALAVYPVTKDLANLASRLDREPHIEISARVQVDG